MGFDQKPWSPRSWQTEFDWYATRVLRYLIGPSLMGWEILADRGHDLALVLVGAMLMTAMDVKQLLTSMIRTARYERQSLEEMLRQELRDEMSAKSSEKPES